MVRILGAKSRFWLVLPDLNPIFGRVGKSIRRPMYANASCPFIALSPRNNVRQFTPIMSISLWMSGVCVAICHRTYGRDRLTSESARHNCARGRAAEGCSQSYSDKAVLLEIWLSEVVRCTFPVAGT